MCPLSYRQKKVDKFICVPTVDQHEADIMEALAEIEEDDRLDDSAVEIPSNEYEE